MLQQRGNTVGIGAAPVQFARLRERIQRRSSSNSRGFGGGIGTRRPYCGNAEVRLCIGLRQGMRRRPQQKGPICSQR